MPACSKADRIRIMVETGNPGPIELVDLSQRATRRPAFEAGKRQVRTAGLLFGLFWPLALAQSHSWAAAVLVDELNAGQFQGASNRQVVGGSQASQGRPSQFSARFRFFGEPSLDQRLIGYVTLVGGNLDALKKCYRQAQGN
jgi:hypothetical protein